MLLRIRHSYPDTTWKICLIMHALSCLICLQLTATARSSYGSTSHRNDYTSLTRTARASATVRSSSGGRPVCMFKQYCRVVVYLPKLVCFSLQPKDHDLCKCIHVISGDKVSYIGSTLIASIGFVAVRTLLRATERWKPFVQNIQMLMLA